MRPSTVQSHRHKNQNTNAPSPQVWQENKYSWRPGMEGHLLFNKAVTKRTNPIPQWASQAIESRRGWRMTVSRGRLCVQRCQQAKVTHQRWSALIPRPTLPTSNITVTFFPKHKLGSSLQSNEIMKRHPPKCMVLPRALA